MSPPRTQVDARLEVLCEKLKDAKLSPEERDGLADDLHRAEICSDPGTRDVLISNVRRALAEPVRVRREMESVLASHTTDCSRAASLDRAIVELNKRYEHDRKVVSESSIEFSLPQILGGRKCRVSGGAVYMLIFVVASFVFYYLNTSRRSSELTELKSELKSEVMSAVHGAALQNRGSQNPLE